MRKLFAFISVLFVLPLAAQDAGAVRQLQKLTQVYRYLNGLYVDEVDMQPLVESAITGMLEDLDPHSAYIGADEMKGVQESFEGEFSGIGVEFNILRDTVTKELILTLEDTPYIVARGRKGGSNIAACICNALIYML